MLHKKTDPAHSLLENTTTGSYRSDKTPAIDFTEESDVTILNITQEEEYVAGFRKTGGKLNGRGAVIFGRSFERLNNEQTGWILKWAKTILIAEQKIANGFSISCPIQPKGGDVFLIKEENSNSWKADHWGAWSNQSGPKNVNLSKDFCDMKLSKIYYWHPKNQF